MLLGSGVYSLSLETSLHLFIGGPSLLNEVVFRVTLTSSEMYVYKT